MKYLIQSCEKPWKKAPIALHKENYLLLQVRENLDPTFPCSQLQNFRYRHKPWAKKLRFKSEKRLKRMFLPLFVISA